MRIVFIRHGEPDYSGVGERGFAGHGIDLAPLTDDGKKQAFEAANDKRLDGIQLIVSSPYTRALQTASIISKHKNTDINIELDLHEWLPDLSFRYTSDTTVIETGKLLSINKGICPENSEMQYEALQTVFERANKCLQKYTKFNKIAVVAHGIVI